jgi:hypothetical protein
VLIVQLPLAFFTTLPQASFEVVGIHVICFGVDVDEKWFSPTAAHRVGCCNKAVADCDHYVSRLYSDSK